MQRQLTETTDIYIKDFYIKDLDQEYHFLANFECPISLNFWKIGRQPREIDQINPISLSLSGT